MKVYLAREDMAYEYNNVLSIHITREGAEKACEEAKQSVVSEVCFKTMEWYVEEWEVES